MTQEYVASFSSRFHDAQVRTVIVDVYLVHKIFDPSCALVTGQRSLFLTCQLSEPLVTLIHAFDPLAKLNAIWLFGEIPCDDFVRSFCDHGASASWTDI